MDLYFIIIHCPLYSIHYKNTVAEPGCASPDDAGCQATVATHGIVATQSKGGFHLGTGMTLTCDLDNRAMGRVVANTEVVIFQRQQINPGHNKISAEQGRVKLVMIGQGRYDGQVLSLNQSQLPISTGGAVHAPGIVVTRQTGFGT